MLLSKINDSETFSDIFLGEFTSLLRLGYSRRMILNMDIFLNDCFFPRFNLFRISPFDYWEWKSSSVPQLENIEAIERRLWAGAGTRDQWEWDIA